MAVLMDFMRKALRRKSASHARLRVYPSPVMENIRLMEVEVKSILRGVKHTDRQTMDAAYFDEVLAKIRESKVDYIAKGVSGFREERITHYNVVRSAPWTIVRPTDGSPEYTGEYAVIDLFERAVYASDNRKDCEAYCEVLNG